MISFRFQQTTRLRIGPILWIVLILILSSCATAHKKDSDSFASWNQARKEEKEKPRAKERPLPSEEPPTTKAPALKAQPTPKFEKAPPKAQRATYRSASGVLISAGQVSRFNSAMKAFDGRKGRLSGKLTPTQLAAKDTLEQVVLLEPHFVEARVNLGLIYELSGDDLKAESLYRKSVQIAPHYYPACVQLGNLLGRKGRASEGIKVLNHCLSKERSTGEKGPRVLAFSKKDLADAYLLRAQLYLKEGQKEKSLQEARKVFLIDADHVETFILVANVYFEQEKWNQSKAYLERALAKLKETRPDSGKPSEEKSRLQAKILNNLALCHWHLGHEAKALSLWQEAMKTDPRFIDSYVHIGQLALQGGDGSRARKIFAQLVRLEPRNSDHRLHLGIAYRMNKKYRAAELEYLRAIRLNSKNDKAYFNLAVLYQKHRQDSKKALLFYERYARLNPQDAQKKEIQDLMESARKDSARKKAKGRK